MQDIWLGLLFGAVVWHFAYQRKLAENARRFIEKYCTDKELQYISCAKVRSRLALDNKKGVQWRNHYVFEFSGDGESRYEGTLIVKGTQVEEINLPVYRVN